ARRPRRREPCRGLSRPALQQVADLGEQLLVLRRRRGRGVLLLLLAHHPAEKLDDKDEEHQGEDQEVHDLAEEQAVGDLLAVEHPLPLEVALLAGHHHADEGHDDVFHQRIDDLAEGGADDHADGEVDDVALEGELLELVEQRERPVSRSQHHRLFFHCGSPFDERKDYFTSPAWRASSDTRRCSSRISATSFAGGAYSGTMPSGFRRAATPGAVMARSSAGTRTLVTSGGTPAGAKNAVQMPNSGSE